MVFQTGMARNSLTPHLRAWKTHLEGPCPPAAPILLHPGITLSPVCHSWIHPPTPDSEGAAVLCGRHWVRPEGYKGE